MCCFCCCFASSPNGGNEIDPSSASASSSKSSNSWKKRQCTDIPAFLLFLAFVAVTAGLGLYGHSKGDLYKILYGVDSFGNTCGRSNKPLNLIGANGTKQHVFLSGENMINRRYLFPLDVRHAFQTAWICVNRCPGETLLELKDLVEFGKRGRGNLCTYHFDDFDSLSSNDVANTGSCPVLPVYQSRPLLNRCVPTDVFAIASDAAQNLIGYVKDFDLVRRVLNDILLVWRDIVRISAASVVVSLVTVFLIRYVAAAVVYFIFLLVVLMASTIVGLCWFLWYHHAAGTRSFDSSLITNISGFLASAQSDKTSDVIDARIYLGIACITTVLACLLIMSIRCLWSRGSLVVNLFQEAGKAVQKMPCLLLQPLATSAVLLGYLVLWAWIASLLYTAAPATLTPLRTIDPKPSQQHEVPVIRFELTPLLRNLLWVHAFGFVWMTEFIFAAQRMIVAVAVACWYFGNERRAPLGNPCLHALFVLCRYHLGSIAFGSLVIAAVKFPRWLLLSSIAMLRGSDSCLIKSIYGALAGILICVEKALTYLHHNAYTVIAINGSSFCVSANIAMNTLMSNAVDVAAINSIGDLVLFLAKAMVAFVMATYAGATFYANDDIAFFYAPTAVCAVVAYGVANCFISVYEMIVDTLFLCYAEDSAMVSRSHGVQEFSNYEFRDFLNQSVKRERRHRQDSAPGSRDLELSEVRQQRRY